MIDLSDASFVGPEPTDLETLQKLPADYREFMIAVNGCILFGGGLHVRGMCESPDWHSLQQVWIGPDALSTLYDSVLEIDIPFAQDVFGDQFMLRDGLVVRLCAETGEIEPLGLSWPQFFDAAAANPVEFLSLQLLVQYTREGGVILPGQLLSVYPPFCTAESSQGVSLKVIPALECIRFLADFASQISAVPDGTQVRLSVDKRD